MSVTQLGWEVFKLRGKFSLAIWCSKDTGQTIYSKDTGHTIYSKDTGQTMYSKDAGQTMYSRISGQSHWFLVAKYGYSK